MGSICQPCDHDRINTTSLPHIQVSLPYPAASEDITRIWGHDGIWTEWTTETTSFIRQLCVDPVVPLFVHRWVSIGATLEYL